MEAKMYILNEFNELTQNQRKLTSDNLQAAKKEADRMTLYHSTNLQILENDKIVSVKLFNSAKNRRSKYWINVNK